MASIAVLIVNYKAGQLILKHLPEIRRELEAFPASEILIVDNDSPNGDGAMLDEALGGEADIRVLHAGDNGGFAAGNNVGFDIVRRDERFDFVLMLNPDAVPRPGALQAMMRVFDEKSDAGFVGAQLLDEDGSDAASAFRFPDASTEFVHHAWLGPLQRATGKWLVLERKNPEERDIFPCDWVSGAAVLIPRRVLEDMPPMDEGFFLYYEETDWLREGVRRGYRAYCQRDAEIVHMAGFSTGIKKDTGTATAMPIYWYRSWRHYFIKNFGRPYALLAALARWSGMAVGYTRARITNWPLPDGRVRVGTFFKECVLTIFKGEMPRK